MDKEIQQETVVKVSLANEKSKELIRRKAEEDQEFQKSAFERLQNSKKSYRVKKESKAEELQNGQKATFRPQLNVKSQVLSRDGNVEEILWKDYERRKEKTKEAGK